MEKIRKLERVTGLFNKTVEQKSKTPWWSADFFVFEKGFGEQKCNEVRKLKNVACTVNTTVVPLSSSGYTMSSVTGWKSKKT